MKTIPILVILIVAQLGSVAQSLSNQVIACAGSYFESGNASLESTAGEAVIPTLEIVGFILTQGFHQPLSEGLPITVEEHWAEDIYVYPNPVATLLTLASSKSLAGMLLQIFDSSGKLVYARQLTGKNTIVPFFDIGDGLYLLEVLNNSGEMHYQTKLIHAN